MHIRLEKNHRLLLSISILIFPFTFLGQNPSARFFLCILLFISPLKQLKALLVTYHHHLIDEEGCDKTLFLVRMYWFFSTSERIDILWLVFRAEICINYPYNINHTPSQENLMDSDKKYFLLSQSYLSDTLEEDFIVTIFRSYKMFLCYLVKIEIITKES